MSFKKTISFTANVSDYTDGTVTARVQAENNILEQFITWILAQNTGISMLEKHAIGSATWAGDPFYCSTSGATSLVNNDSLCTDIYILGNGINKKCIGLAIDNHVLRVGMTDTVERDLVFPMSSGQQYGRVPPAFIRRVKNDGLRLVYASTINCNTFSTSENTLILTIVYYRKEGQISVVFGNNNVLFIGQNSAALIRNTTNFNGSHFSLNDDFLISDASYSYSANNSNYASNLALNYCMSYAPFCIRTSNNSPVQSVCTSVYCHSMFVGDMELSQSPLSCKIYRDGMSTTAVAPMVFAAGFPRIDNSEIYIKKMYIPMTKPAETSPLKIGFVPGLLTCGNVYKINNKYYVSLNSGIWGLFAEVEDQGA